MSKTRVQWIDFVRAIAILTVLYIHATDGIFIISSDAVMNFGLYSRLFQFASLFIGRIGVPFFLMITGYRYWIEHTMTIVYANSGPITVRN